MTESENPSLLSVPAFWPMAMAATMFKEGTELYAKNLRFVEEEIKIHGELRPALAWNCSWERARSGIIGQKSLAGSALSRQSHRYDIPNRADLGWRNELRN